jgi:hypothetical protein
MLDAARGFDELAYELLLEAKLAQVSGKTFGRQTTGKAGHGDR